MPNASFHEPRKKAFAAQCLSLFLSTSIPFGFTVPRFDFACQVPCQAGERSSRIEPDVDSAMTSSVASAARMIRRSPLIAVEYRHERVLFFAQRLDIPWASDSQIRRS
jgi:hypothetical protein